MLKRDVGKQSKKVLTNDELCLLLLRFFEVLYVAALAVLKHLCLTFARI